MLSLPICLRKFALIALSCSFAGSVVFAADVATPSANPASESVKKSKSAANMHSPSDADKKLLKALDTNLQKSKSVSMKFAKTYSGAVLETKNESTGTLLVSKGRLRMEINPPNHKLVIFGNQGLWTVEFPPAEFKDAKLQVAHAANEKKAAALQGLIGSLLKGKITSYFKILNVEIGASGDKTYFLTPAKMSTECNRAEAVISKDAKELRELRYWDSQGNETIYVLSDVKMDVPVADSDFQYTPPKNADVSAM